MAIAFRAATSTSVTAATLTLTKPTGTASGDVLVAWIYVDTSGTVSTPPTNWVQVDSVHETTNNYTAYVYRLVCGGSEPGSYSWTMSASGYTEGIVAGFSGVDNTTPIDVHGIADRGSTQSPVTPSLTTTNANDALVAMLGVWNANTGASAQNGYTLPTNGQTSGGDFWLEYLLGASQGSVGNNTFSCTAGNSGAVAALVALKPAGAGGTAWNQSLTDAQSAQDTRLNQAQKRPSEFHSALDSLTKAYTSSQSEKFSSLDAALKAAQHRLTGDTISATDSVQRARGSVWSIVDAFSSRESITQHLLSKLLSETLSGVDTTRFATTHALVDTLVLVDVLSKLPSHLLSDIISSTDSVSEAKNAGAVAWAKTLTDSQSAQDARLTAVTKPLSETQSAQDLRTALVIKALAENLVLVDSQSWQTTHRIVESLSATDKLTAGRALLLALQEWFSSTDVSTEVKQAALAQGHLAVLSLTISLLLGVHLAISTSASISAVVGALSQAIHAATGLVNALQSLRTIAISLQATVTVR